MSAIDALTVHAHKLLISEQDLTPAVRLARSLHATPPATPAAIRAHLHDAPHVLPALSRHAQAGDRHALLIAAVLMRNQLRTIAAHAGGDDDATSDTLTLFWTLISTTAEPQTITEKSVTYQLVKHLDRLTRRPAPVVIEPHDPHAAIFDQPRWPEPDRRTQATQVLTHARDHNVITALEYQTLNVLYLQTGTAELSVAARSLHATASAIERRAQRAIRKLVVHYSRPGGSRFLAA
jgi:hypothetical protein